ncbi:hypothetical protein PR048_004080 [Dryococelus australis]|uniref:PiggyBac transposable element-derived protein domain-containing protein n=1 Tax=Dryococelus australis TaxID=614101 RepID=A0ABQ9I4I2_9NEOP|nr:hypothetical protein PR048_004080 [Dryococelus australis]
MWHSPEGSKQEFFFHGEFTLNPEVVVQTSDPFFKMSTIPSMMFRNRFEPLLSMWHFSDDELQLENDRLYKLTNVVDYLSQNFKKCILKRNCMRKRNNCTIQRMFVNEAILPHENPQVQHENIQSVFWKRTHMEL